MKLSNKKIIIITLIGISIMITTVIFLLSTRNGQKDTTLTNLNPTIVPPSIKKQSGPPVQTSLISFQQKTATSAAIIIDTGGKSITGVQLEIGFDPVNINSIAIEPGGFFNQAHPLLNKIDYKEGSIFYALAIPPTGNAEKGAGEVATIYYSFYHGAFNPTIFQFLPKTKVSAQGIEDSTLKTATPISVASSY